MEIPKIVNQQNNYFNSNSTKDIVLRINTLKKLKGVIQENETKLYKAIYAYFKKSEFETYIAEIALIYNELNDAIKNDAEILACRFSTFTLSNSWLV